MRLPVRRSSDDEPGEFARLRDQLFADLDRWPQLVEESLREVLPATDVEETDDTYLVDVELPGVRPEDVSLEIRDGRLVVDGVRRRRERVGLVRHRTRTTGRLHLELTLPLEVDSARTAATLDHGLLHVEVPKAPAARRRRIPVTVRDAAEPTS